MKEVRSRLKRDFRLQSIGSRLQRNLTKGNLEKLLSLPIADSLGANVNESERERSGIIRRQFCGVR
jgi:ribosomal 50S subunit-associated protein YjgA (DUF615 family)